MGEPDSLCKERALSFCVKLYLGAGRLQKTTCISRYQKPHRPSGHVDAQQPQKEADNFFALTSPPVGGCQGPSMPYSNLLAELVTLSAAGQPSEQLPRRG